MCVCEGVGGSTNLQELLSLLPGVPVEVLLAARGEPHGDNSICNVRQVQVEAIANVPALLKRDGRPARAEHCVRVISRACAHVGQPEDRNWNLLRACTLAGMMAHAWAHARV